MQQSPFQLPSKSPFRIFESIFEKLTGLSKLHKLYLKRPIQTNPEVFLDYTISALNIQYQLITSKEDFLPQKGSVIVTANHPLGGAEGVILARELLKKRKDVKILANEFLSRITELEPLFINVDVFSEKNTNLKNIQAIRSAYQHLKNDGVLLVFPAGAVSTYKNGELTDDTWSTSLAILAKKSKSTVLPIFINAKNSRLFYFLGNIHPLLRTLRLAKELLNKYNQNIQFVIGEPITFQEVKNISNINQNLLDYYRLNTYALKHYNHENTPFPIYKNTHQDYLHLELDLIENDLVLEQGKYRVYCSNSQQIPQIMNEIGKMREKAFCQIGEGTGNDIDIDIFDHYYKQLFIWNSQDQDIVGAYRIGNVDQIYRQKGIDGLYTKTLFNYEESFINSIGKSLELGRSVVNPKYQKAFQPLLLLWKGIAHYVSAQPDITHLYGPVSISPLYSKISQRLMIDALTLHHYDATTASFIQAKNPPNLPNIDQWVSPNSLKTIENPQLLSRLIHRIEGDKGLPILLRQYLGLRGKLLSFNIDPLFNDTMDGLILVNLLDVDPKTLACYMGKEKTQQYLNYHYKEKND